MITELAAAGTAALGAGWMAYAVRGRSSQVFCPAIWRVKTARPLVALTFDDGPGPGTLQVLELLDRHRVQATFFFCGANARRWPQIARQVAEAGHEIGNHSDTHPYLVFRSRQFMTDELRRAQRALEDITGRRVRWFRPPFGARWFGIGSVLEELGLQCVMWTVIGNDWKWPGPVVAEHVIRNRAPGAIVCLHDGRNLQPQPDISSTVEALRLVIPGLLNRGFQFETISNLLCQTSSYSA